MNKIIPHLWFDKEANEAAEFYTSIFSDSKINSVKILHDTPSGDVETVSFDLMGFEFMAISAGPMFKFNPSISFIVNFDPSRDKNAGEKLDEIWNKLSEGGKELMPLDKYPFSERYGWIQDKYGLSWQLILSDPNGEERPELVPSMLFTGENTGKAEEALNYYLSIFKDSRKGNIARYPAGMEPDREGTVMYSDFALENIWFAAMDSAREQGYNFNEAISFMVNCRDQDEIDYYWKRLSAKPDAEQCGWIKDRFGVSWQIVPENMDELMSRNPEKTTPVMLDMKKIIIADLERAGEER